MIKNFRELLSTSAGKITAIVLASAFAAWGIYSVYSFTRSSEPDFANYTMYICTETGKTFRHRNQEGDTLPLYSRYSGKNTAVPAEPCYWTRDGGVKSDPTWVLVNEFIKKPGPTFCPDCGRLVVGHNPHPGPGIQPPPTEEEWNARVASRQQAEKAHDVAPQ